jgi:hypothetical protein
VAAHLNLLRRQQVLGVDLLQMEAEWLQLEWVKNPKGFGFYLLVKPAPQRTAG